MTREDIEERLAIRYEDRPGVTWSLMRVREVDPTSYWVAIRGGQGGTVEGWVNTIEHLDDLCDEAEGM